MKGYNGMGYKGIATMELINVIKNYGSGLVELDSSGDYDNAGIVNKLMLLGCSEDDCKLIENIEVPIDMHRVGWSKDSSDIRNSIVSNTIYGILISNKYNIKLNGILSGDDIISMQIALEIYLLHNVTINNKRLIGYTKGYGDYDELKDTVTKILAYGQSNMAKDLFFNNTIFQGEYSELSNMVSESPIRVCLEAILRGINFGIVIKDLILGCIELYSSGGVRFEFSNAGLSIDNNRYKEDGITEIIVCNDKEEYIRGKGMLLNDMYVKIGSGQGFSWEFKDEEHIVHVEQVWQGEGFKCSMTDDIVKHNGNGE